MPSISNSAVNKIGLTSVAILANCDGPVHGIKIARQQHAMRPPGKCTAVKSGNQPTPPPVPHPEPPAGEPPESASRISSRLHLPSLNQAKPSPKSQSTPSPPDLVTLPLLNQATSSPESHPKASPPSLGSVKIVTEEPIWPCPTRPSEEHHKKIGPRSRNIRNFGLRDDGTRPSSGSVKTVTDEPILAEDASRCNLDRSLPLSVMNGGNEFIMPREEGEQFVVVRTPESSVKIMSRLTAYKVYGDSVAFFSMEKYREFRQRFFEENGRQRRMEEELHWMEEELRRIKINPDTAIKPEGEVEEFVQKRPTSSSEDAPALPQIRGVRGN